MPTRVMALDVGEKRIGIAIGDSEVKIAVPNGMIENNSEVVNELKSIIKQKEIDTIVVGLPRNSSGEETRQTQYVRDFSKNLSNLGLPIIFQDESLTSVEAKEVIQSQKQISQADRKDGLVDAKAAAIILTDYLEANYGRK